MYVLLHVLLFSSICAISYAVLWRIKLDFTSLALKQRIVFAIFAGLFLVSYFSYLLPGYFFFDSFSLKNKPDYTFYETDVFGFALVGLFSGLFCLIPMSGWFDVATKNNPAFQRKSNKQLITFILTFVFLPNLFLGLPHSKFESDEVCILTYFSLIRTCDPYSELRSIKIESDRESRSRKTGSKSVDILTFYYITKKGDKVAFYKTEFADPSLTARVAKLTSFLKTKGIAYDDSILIYHTDWQSILDRELLLTNPN